MPDHTPAIRRLIDRFPPFRPGAAPSELVAAFAVGAYRMPAFVALASRGPGVLPAVREGLAHENAHVRQWCALFADNFADAETLHAVVPLLHDGDPRVRVWAVHTLACERCKSGPNPVDAVPLLLERIEADTSLKVRRQAVAMLAHHREPDARVVPVLRRILASETDRKLRLHAEAGLRRYAACGVDWTE